MSSTVQNLICWDCHLGEEVRRRELLGAKVLAMLSDQQMRWIIKKLVSHMSSEQVHASLEDLGVAKKDSKIEYPKYASLGVGGPALSLSEVHDSLATYSRPAGVWSVVVEWVYGELTVVDRQMSHLIGSVLKEVSEEEFRNDNEGYV